MNMPPETADQPHSPDHQRGDGMSTGMPTIFTVGTEMTLFFTGWKTTSTSLYILTLALIFILTILNRFLAALRFKIEESSQRDGRDAKPPAIPILAPPHPARHRSIPKARLSPLPAYMKINRDYDHEESLNLTESHPYESDEEDEPFTHQGRRPSTAWIPRVWAAMSRNWRPRRPWSWKSDAVRGVLEGTRALIGYLLMLAVMTLNVGVFCAVLAGIVIGEMVLGRYTQRSTSGWEDGACHDG